MSTISDRPPSPQGPTALVATLGNRPGVITVALDLLLTHPDGGSIDEVVVFHTARPRPTKGIPDDATGDLMSRCLQALEHEFPQRAIYGHAGLPCRYRPVQLELDGHPIDDVKDEQQARAVFATMFHEIQALKWKDYRVHLCIAGGRKSMSVYGMAVAQLLFDQRDRLWHVSSTSDFETSQLTHPRQPDDAHLIRIPLFTFRAVHPPVVALLASTDPLRDIEMTMRDVDQQSRRNAELFLTSLSAPHRRLVDRYMRALVHEHRALSNEELGRREIIAGRTARNRMSEVYDLLRIHLGIPADRSVGRELLASFLDPYYRSE